MIPCPSPETLIAYIEGRIDGKQKKDIYDHIANCEDCMDALQAAFDAPTEKELEEEQFSKEVIEKAKRIPKMYPKDRI